MNWPSSCSAIPVPVMLKKYPRETAIDENEWLSFRQSWKLGYEIDPNSKLGLLACRTTSCSGCGNGSGFKSTPLTIEKMAVLAPMPSARVNIAIAVNPGLLRSMRTPKRRSCPRVSIQGSVWRSR